MEVIFGFLLVLVFSALVYFPVKHAVASVLCNECNQKICICADEVHIIHDEGEVEAWMMYDMYIK